MVFRENIGDFTDLHNEKKLNLEVTCKRNRFGYWNLCKCLPNFVHVAALLQTNIIIEANTMNPDQTAPLAGLGAV